ncbi:hypothetical protein T484DRAFT_1934142 [Baffinella frigidus]|nr:hypothetical protein T484DRAFT_1934142 [Cryptophyta sp. CCMP2293]
MPGSRTLLGVAAGAISLAMVLVAFTPNATPSERLEVVEIPAGAEIVNIPRSALRQRSLRSSALSGGYKAVEDDSEPLDGTVTKEEWVGRCRCVGQGKGDMRVVCACTKPDDLWRKGPYSVVTGYTVVYDKHDDDYRDFGKYLTIVAQGFPDGPKENPHYYTLIQPWDDNGKATMTDLYPDGPLGVPQDGFFMFETSGSNYPAFKSSDMSMLREDQEYAGVFPTPLALVQAIPPFAKFFE